MNNLVKNHSLKWVFIVAMIAIILMPMFVINVSAHASSACTNCSGSGLKYSSIPCSSCSGSGNLTCSSCGGSGTKPAGGSAISGCTACGGSGGSGMSGTTSDYVVGSGKNSCSTCNGSGNRIVSINCSPCNGTGNIGSTVTPSPAPTSTPDEPDEPDKMPIPTATPTPGHPDGDRYSVIYYDNAMCSSIYLAYSSASGVAVSIVEPAKISGFTFLEWRFSTSENGEFIVMDVDNMPIVNSAIKIYPVYIKNGTVPETSPKNTIVTVFSDSTKKNIHVSYSAKTGDLLSLPKSETMTYVYKKSFLEWRYTLGDSVDVKTIDSDNLPVVVENMKIYAVYVEDEKYYTINYQTLHNNTFLFFDSWKTVATDTVAKGSKLNDVSADIDYTKYILATDKQCKNKLADDYIPKRDMTIYVFDAVDISEISISLCDLRTDIVNFGTYSVFKTVKLNKNTAFTGDNSFIINETSKINDKNVFLGWSTTAVIHSNTLGVITAYPDSINYLKPTEKITKDTALYAVYGKKETDVEKVLKVFIPLNDFYLGLGVTSVFLQYVLSTLTIAVAVFLIIAIGARVLKMLWRLIAGR